MNLLNPLTAEDELKLSKTSVHETVKFTAGLHRQTWVSGIAIFVDVHILNSSQKTVRKIELQLERVTAFYNHAPAVTSEEIAAHLRLPDRTEKEIVASRSTKKARHGWQGIAPMSQDVRTCYLEVPSGLVTIDTGELSGIGGWAYDVIGNIRS